MNDINEIYDRLVAIEDGICALLTALAELKKDFEELNNDLEKTLKKLD